MRKLPDHSLEFLPKYVRVNGSSGKHRTFHLHSSDCCLFAAFSQRNNVAAAIGCAPDAGNMAMAFQSAQGFTHGLGLDADILGQLCLGHGPLRRKNFNGDHTGMGQPNGSQLFVP